MDFPEARAFWWPRFLRIAHWFADWELARRARRDHDPRGDPRRDSDPLGEHGFTLRRAPTGSSADDGSYAILDYKTGQAPTEQAGAHGTGAAAHPGSRDPARGWLSRHSGRRVGQRARLCAAQGRRSAGRAVRGSSSRRAPPTARPTTRCRRLTGRCTGAFADEAPPTRSLNHPMWTNHYGDYDHLARVKEWSASGGERRDRGMVKAPRSSRAPVRAAGDARPIRARRLGRPPMPDPARPTCWCSA